MHLDKLDHIDLKILEILQSQARIKRKDLAENVPSDAFSAVAKDNAKKIKELLETAGAKVELS